MDLIIRIQNLEISAGVAAGEWTLTTESGELVNSDYVDIAEMVKSQLEEENPIIGWPRIEFGGDNARHSGWFVAILVDTKE